MKIVALAGGVGGAKLAEGLYHAMQPEDLTIIVNTADDFVHYGLHISPDIDTICYTLAGLVNPETGWGRKNEGWLVLEELGKLGAEDWFRLGDRDLATHLERSRRLAEGQNLSEIVADFSEKWGINARILPMSNEAVRTLVNTPEGQLSFQEYFVGKSFAPEVQSFEFEGAKSANAAPGVLESIESADAVIICPSNPFVSIDPILSIPGIRESIAAKPTLAVSPIIGGKAVKGPAAKIFREMGMEPSAMAVAEHYGSLISLLVLDEQDADELEAIESKGIMAELRKTIMKSFDDRLRLAREILEIADTYASSPQNKKNNLGNSLI